MSEAKSPRPVLDLSAALPERERVRLPFGEYEIALPGDLSFRDNQRVDYMVRRMAEMEAREWCFHSAEEHAEMAAAALVYASNRNRWKRTHPGETPPKPCEMPVITDADSAEYDRLRLEMAQAVLRGAPAEGMADLDRDYLTAIASGFLTQRWLMQQQTIQTTQTWAVSLLEHMGIPLESVWMSSALPSASNGRGPRAASKAG